MVCCDGKTARRILVGINILNLIFGIAFIGTGGVSIGAAKGLKEHMDDYCQTSCQRAVPNMQCDCDKGTTKISFEIFSAPGAGLCAVGVFSILTAIFGLVSAVRASAKWIMVYIVAISFIILLQFSFGIAAAAIEKPKQVQQFEDLLTTEPELIDWSYMGPLLPKACHAAATDYNNSKAVYHPACSWEQYCMRSVSSCCDAKCAENDIDEGRCLCVKSDQCATGSDCMNGIFKQIGAPVAGLALASLFLEIIAVTSACQVFRRARMGDYSPNNKQVEMNSI